MRKNISQSGTLGKDGWYHIENDWYERGIPPNVHFEEGVYLDTAYSFAAFNSELDPAMTVGRYSGCYDRATFITGRKGRIKVGAFTMINGATIISQKEVVIGDHCMLAWGCVVTDDWPGVLSTAERAAILQRGARDRQRELPVSGRPQPVRLRDNCWIGFDAVVLPGVTIGRSAIVGSKSVVVESVPDYAIVVGNPARVIRFLHPNDTEDKKQKLLAEYGIIAN